MKVLLDTCLSVKARDALQAVGHDVVWGGDWDEDPGDEAILALAFQHRSPVPSPEIRPLRPWTPG